VVLQKLVSNSTYTKLQVRWDLGVLVSWYVGTTIVNDRGPFREEYSEEEPPMQKMVALAIY